MLELPSNFNKKLPQHTVVMADGTVRSDVICTGTEVIDVYQDVVLFNGGCGNCSRGFIYMPKTNTWMPEDEFEKLLQDSAGTLGKTMQSL
jgi:hypothetical protein